MLLILQNIISNFLYIERPASNELL